ncbi:phage antirepressor KilAC domain-containing protein [Lactococcus garvieae]|uniref:Phage antirepressor KilAC domain-containing protein n=1 Tax=Lactococcus garvieae TaxID=1363 RepID=A0AAX3NGX8_9LACT|nr:phage antirepressor KilAC domain-containing protein [Lactococcus garvieae]NHI70470.1 DNA-binding protein [Lactococcus garvieae]NHJ08268.1 DNA-binding protein [Lactococcus garvieae]WEA14859.1 phage antirepressor KilAC domain-containing protein [Lactococcus garvieae]
MNKLQNFTNGIFNLDIKVENEQVLFSAEQVAKSLGFTTKTNGREYVRWNRVNEFLPQVAKIEKGSFISEPMVYKLAFKANNAVSEKFTDWLAVEVLPTIRKHGAYMTDAKAKDVLSGNGLADLLLQAGNQIKQLESEKEAMKIELEEATERTRYLDLILESPDKMTTTQIAFDYGTGAPTFNKLLASLKIQRKVNGQWILYRQYMGKGYTKTETFPITHKDGRRGTTTNTVWTQKGREFLYRKLKKNGYLPLVEQDDLAS